MSNDKQALDIVKTHQVDACDGFLAWKRLLSGESYQMDWKRQQVLPLYS